MNSDSQGKNIICFGNSITYGQGADKGYDYPARLKEMVSREVLNKGCCGETTQNALERIEEDVLSLDPYLVIVEFGANDYFNNISKGTVIANLENIALKIQGVGAKVALCDVSGGWRLFKKYDIYHSAIKHIANKTQSAFIPFLMKGIIQRRDLMCDSFHPNSKGYEIIAQKVYKAIVPYL